MPFIGNKPSAIPLTSADIADGIITSAKIVDGTIVNADIDASAGIASTKLSGSFGITEADVFRVNSGFTGDANIYVSTNGGSSWDSVATGLTMLKNITGGLNSVCSCTAESLIDVTSTANVKVKFSIFKQNATTTSYGATDSNRVYSTFIRLGDT
jgi:hypothetical protein